MDQGLNPVAHRPGRPVRMPPVELGEVVAALGAGEKPILEGADLYRVRPHRATHLRNAGFSGFLEAPPKAPTGRLGG